VRRNTYPIVHFRERFGHNVQIPAIRFLAFRTCGLRGFFPTIEVPTMKWIPIWRCWIAFAPMCEASMNEKHRRQHCAVCLELALALTRRGCEFTNRSPGDVALPA
jgi:hypothetical protein